MRREPRQGYVQPSWQTFSCSWSSEVLLLRNGIDGSSPQTVTEVSLWSNYLEVASCTGSQRQSLWNAHVLGSDTTALSLWSQNPVITGFKEGIQMPHNSQPEKHNPGKSLTPPWSLFPHFKRGGRTWWSLGSSLKFNKHFVNVMNDFRQTPEFQKWKCQLNNE